MLDNDSSDDILESMESDCSWQYMKMHFLSVFLWLCETKQLGDAVVFFYTNDVSHAEDLIINLL